MARGSPSAPSARADMTQPTRRSWDLRGQTGSEAGMMEAVRAAGVDMAALGRDLKAHDSDIGDLLKRNDDQAKTLGLQGTPVYLIGPFIVAAALDYDGFKDAVAKFRAHIGKGAPRSE